MIELKHWLIGSALLLQSCAVLSGTGPSGAKPPTSGAYDLNFDAGDFRPATTDVNGRAVRYRAYEGIVYVRNPQDTAYQRMNVYVPEDYFEGGSIGAYNARTAPIFLPNGVGGYLPAEPGTPQVGSDQAGPGQSGPNSILVALSRGYVVASPGARGRTTKNAAGEYIGKAPAAIVDLKAAVRYLRANDDAMPGNAERIISNGTSAGGALSALLGASGNNPDYAPYLAALGAADARDDIYAVSSYCPITNLEHADAAYEWQFNGVNDYTKLQISRDTDFRIQRTLVPGTLTAQEIALSNDLRPTFSDYVNTLRLRNGTTLLTLDQNGNGSFKNRVAGYVQASAQAALTAGQDLSAATYLTVADGRVTGLDFDAYVRAIGRMKTPPAFDGLSLENAENELFGTRTVGARHFTAFSAQRSKVSGPLAEPEVVRLMNPMNYLGASATQRALHWRIRQGTADRDTSAAIPVILATRLASAGYDVDFAMPWNQGHGGDYDLDQLFAWMDRVAAP